MIFVTLGTQDKTFERLLRKIDELIEKKIIQDEVVVQAGNTYYESADMKIFDFTEQAQINHYIDECSYMITHAGIGSIMNGMNHGKKIIAVARRAKYGEHVNDHQVEITTKFADAGYILGCVEVDELEEKISLLKDFKTKQYESNNENFCNLIEKLIENEDMRKN